MRLLACFLTLSVGGAFGGTIYNNLTPNNAIGMATRTDTAAFEIETADDFFLSGATNITSASLVGLIVPGAAGTGGSISEVVAEMYRIFPLDSNTTRTPNVPTRANSPSDVAFDSRSSSAGGLTFSSSVLNPTFTVLNSIQPGGIHASPNQHTLGNGPLTGQEVQINLTFATPFSLSDSHLFFVPQVTLTNGAQFYWLSGSRPISGPGTTPFPAGVTDLQAWTRDQNLDPDWLRVAADIVGGTAFNAAFSLDGSAVPEPTPFFIILGGMTLIAAARGLRRAR